VLGQFADTSVMPGSHCAETAAAPRRMARDGERPSIAAGKAAARVLAP
jgi:hypothetical protein